MKKKINVHAYPASLAAQPDPRRKPIRKFADSRDIHEDRGERQIKLTRSNKTNRAISAGSSRTV
jgi:hypothetical protein